MRNQSKVRKFNFLMGWLKRNFCFFIPTNCSEKITASLREMRKVP